jgi:ATP-dependent protease HslVU (ClpYQ) peptidase subunit
VLVLNSTGLFVYAGTFHPDAVTDEHYAIGTGAHAALAAMRCGKTAEEAVEIACDIDTNSGPPVQTHMLKQPRAPRKTGTANG